MKETQGDIWAVEADAICIPTNGRLNIDGELIMGAGMALQAKKRFPNLPREAGKLVDLYGNIPFYFARWKLITFPTKRAHWEDASISLIKGSAHALVGIADREGLSAIALPRVGAGLGRLSWGDVEAVLKPILDDRFVVVSLPEA